MIQEATRVTLGKTWLNHECYKLERMEILKCLCSIFILKFSLLFVPCFEIYSVIGSTIFPRSKEIRVCTIALALWRWPIWAKIYLNVPCTHNDNGLKWFSTLKSLGQSLTTSLFNSPFTVYDISTGLNVHKVMDFFIWHDHVRFTCVITERIRDPNVVDLTSIYGECTVELPCQAWIFP